MGIHSFLEKHILKVGPMEHITKIPEETKYGNREKMLLRERERQGCYQSNIYGEVIQVTERQEELQ